MAPHSVGTNAVTANKSKVSALPPFNETPRSLIAWEAMEDKGEMADNADDAGFGAATFVVASVDTEAVSATVSEVTVSADPGVDSSGGGGDGGGT